MFFIHFRHEMFPYYQKLCSVKFTAPFPFPVPVSLLPSPTNGPFFQQWFTEPQFPPKPPFLVLLFSSTSTRRESPKVDQWIAPMGALVTDSLKVVLINKSKKILQRTNALLTFFTKICTKVFSFFFRLGGMVRYKRTAAFSKEDNFFA